MLVDRALFIWLYRRCPRILDAITNHEPFELASREAGQKKIFEQRRTAKTAERQEHCSHQRLLGKRGKGAVAEFFYSTRQQLQLAGKPLSILRLSGRHDSIIKSPERARAQSLCRQSQCHGATDNDEQGDARRDEIRKAHAVIGEQPAPRDDQQRNDQEGIIDERRYALGAFGHEDKVDPVVENFGWKLKAMAELLQRLLRPNAGLHAKPLDDAPSEQRRVRHRKDQEPRRQQDQAPHRDVSHGRSEEHTSELQSPDHLVCRLLLEKKKKDDTP